MRRTIASERKAAHERRVRRKREPGFPAAKRVRESARVFLSLGANVGDRAMQLKRARETLRNDPRIQILRETSILESRALLHEDQPDFLNQIVETAAELAPLELLDFLQAAEESLGRVRRFRYGPREIDLDILAYDSLRWNDARLTLPHPGLRDRPYLRTLLAELDESPESLGVRDASDQDPADDAEGSLLP